MEEDKKRQSLMLEMVWNGKNILGFSHFKRSQLTFQFLEEQSNVQWHEPRKNHLKVGLKGRSPIIDKEFFQHVTVNCFFVLLMNLSSEYNFKERF